MGHERLRIQRDGKPVPSPTKRCKRCRQTLPLTNFPRRRKGGQGVAAVCQSCLDERYATEEFGCSRCRRRLPGRSFFQGAQGSAIRQPCKACISSAIKTATRLRQIERGQSPYHILYDVDEDSRTARCRECGPTHIYSTGTKQGRGWRCGKRSDETSEEWYNAKAAVVDKHASARWHRVRNVRGAEMRGTCTLCGDAPVRWQQSGSRFVCASPTRKRQHADNWRRWKRLAVYGLTQDDFERMKAEQRGVCAICGGTKARADSDGELVVDHCHKTGTVRGLLCGLCNAGIGYLRENPLIFRAAVAYIQRNGGEVEVDHSGVRVWCIVNGRGDEGLP